MNIDGLLQADRERKAALVTEIGLDPATVVDGGVEWSATDPRAITVTHIGPGLERWTTRVEVTDDWLRRWGAPVAWAIPHRGEVNAGDEVEVYEVRLGDPLPADTAPPPSPGYDYQAVDHHASISAQRDEDDPDQVVVEIVVGDAADARIVMWAEDFAQMARAVLDE